MKTNLLIAITLSIFGCLASACGGSSSPNAATSASNQVAAAPAQLAVCKPLGCDDLFGNGTIICSISDGFEGYDVSQANVCDAAFWLDGSCTDNDPMDYGFLKECDYGPVIRH